MPKNIFISLTRTEALMTIAMVAAILEGMDQAIKEGREIEDRDQVSELLEKLGGQFEKQDDEKE